jgi:predicted dehydrogenase
METLVNIKPRLAFAGVGWIGRNRMQAALQNGIAEAAGFVDPSAECIREASNIAPDGKIYTSFEEALFDPSIDAVVIATPSAMHMQQAVMSLEQGKAVFCQKPLGRNADEVTAVLQAAIDADRLLGADFSYRYTSAFQAVRNEITSGELGHIFAVELKFHNAYGPDKPWFYDIQKSGGGCVLDLGVHLIDLLLFAFDFPRASSVNSRLFAAGNELKLQDRVEDYADVMIRLDNEVHAHLSCSWNLHAGTEAIIEASFFGTKGGASMRNVNGSFYDFEAIRFSGTMSQVIASPPDDWGGKAISHWVSKLSRSNRFDHDALNFQASAEIIDRIYAIERKH